MTMPRACIICVTCLLAACSQSAAPPAAPPPAQAAPGAHPSASPPSAPAASTGAAVETGTLEGAGFRIDMPARWNNGLVVWFHGYAITPVQLPRDEPLAPQLQQLVARGYAVAQSAYSATGWALEQASADGERLRQHFIEEHGAPRETLAAGMSMGGTLTVMAMEMHPDVYAGGLSLCGAIEPSDALLQRDFALVAAFNFYFPDLLGAWTPVPADYAPTAQVVAKISAALRARPDAARSLLRIWGVGNLQTLADILAFDYAEIGELQRRTRGNPFDNADFIYTGSTDDAALNDGVPRFRADAPAAGYVSRWYTPTGNLEHPLLALHDTGDPLVPASGAFAYALAVQRSGHAGNFVQQYVNRDGHCVFKPEEVGRAFDELLVWIRYGLRPPSGALPD
jgi:pimeloyl-ACP methyl ester carboxylesterase